MVCSLGVLSEIAGSVRSLHRMAANDNKRDYIRRSEVQTPAGFGHLLGSVWQGITR